MHQQITFIIYLNLFPNKGKFEALGWKHHNRVWIYTYRVILKTRQFKEGFWFEVELIYKNKRTHLHIIYEQEDQSKNYSSKRETLPHLLFIGYIWLQIRHENIWERYQDIPDNIVCIYGRQGSWHWVNLEIPLWFEYSI